MSQNAGIAMLFLGLLAGYLACLLRYRRSPYHDRQ
jgi:hypothetical protein